MLTYQSRATARESLSLPPRPRMLSWTLDLILRRTSSLSASQQLRLFRLLKELLRDDALLMPGVMRVPGTPEHFVLYEFCAPLLHRYNGFELVVFDDRSSVYYRMPGAAAGGNGNVEQGCHRLYFKHWNLREPLYLHLEKSSSGLRISSVSRLAEPGVTFRRVEGYHLNYAKLSLELEAKVHRCLRECLAVSDELRALSPPTLQWMLQECAELGPQLSALSAMYRERVANR